MIEARDKAEVVLERNWGAVEETAGALVEHETLSGLALDAVLSTVKPTPLTFLEGDGHESASERQSERDREAQHGGE